MDTRTIIIICGPTGVGKSDFAELLAQQISGEIVNMDLGQFYTPLSIGTAKPDWRNARVPHHLFDILDTPQNFTVVQYRERLLQTCNALWERNVTPVVVGGSMFYLKSLFFPPAVAHEGLWRGYAAENADASHHNVKEGGWEELNAIDPDRAAALHKNDTYRINRAMEIWRTKGIKPSLYQPNLEMPCNVIMLYLTRNRDDLYARIDTRVIMMLQAGWLDEVRPLCDTPWETFLHEKKLIGYNELLGYLHQSDEGDEFDSVIRIIQQRSRHYAKRQQTFWRGLEKRLKDSYQAERTSQYTLETDTVNLTLWDVNLYIKQLLDRLKNR
jgi:tRNA dimethylallyltransferase